MMFGKMVERGQGLNLHLRMTYGQLIHRASGTWCS
jgi:hypothetical protein